MPISYDTLGASITIEPTGAIAPGDLNTTVGIVGNYDDANLDSSVTPGEAVSVTSRTEAENLFGAKSELARQAELAFRNGAGTVEAVALPETESTETFSAVQTGTVSNAPIGDPRVSTATITAQDTVDATSVTVNAVDGTPSAPSSSNTLNINPRTGEFAADSSSDYEITYTYGDFATALDEATGLSVRYIAVCTAADTIVGDARDKLETEASNFRFKRAVVGAEPTIAAADITSYTTAVEDWRIVETAPVRGTMTDGRGARTVGAVAGLLAAQPINVSGSITYDDLAGFESYTTSYAPAEAEDFTQVTAITDESQIADGVTTSAESELRDIYKAEIIDFTTERLHQRVKNYRGGSNAQSAQRRFRSRLYRTLSALSAPQAQPPLLATGDGTRPFSVTISTGSDPSTADVDVAISPAPIAKQVNLTLSTGPINFDGVQVS